MGKKELKDNQGIAEIPRPLKLPGTSNTNMEKAFHLKTTLQRPVVLERKCFTKFTKCSLPPCNIFLRD